MSSEMRVSGRYIAGLAQACRSAVTNRDRSLGASGWPPPRRRYTPQQAPIIVTPKLGLLRNACWIRLCSKKKSFASSAVHPGRDAGTRLVAGTPSRTADMLFGRHIPDITYDDCFVTYPCVTRIGRLCSGKRPRPPPRPSRRRPSMPRYRQVRRGLIVAKCSFWAWQSQGPVDSLLSLCDALDRSAMAQGPT